LIESFHDIQLKSAMNYQLITNDTALNSLCSALQEQPWLAIDTEFMRQDTFFAQLALIQIATPSLDVFLIDPLSIEDLSPLWTLMTQPKLVKVFHAARQDLEILFQQAQRIPAPIFDTQIAGVFLGLGDQASYARLIETLCHETLNKDQARTQWLERPLDEEQLAYAAADVWYLAQAYPKLLDMLSTDQLQAIQADFNALTSLDLYEINPSQAWSRMKPSAGFNQKQLGLLKYLAAWREEQAVELNQPRKWIIGDDPLLQLAKRPVRLAQELHKLNHFNGELIRQYGDTLITLIDQAMQAPEEWPDLPKVLELNAEQHNLLQIMQAISQHIAQKHSIHLPNLTNKQELTALICKHPSQLDQGWRSLLLGHLLKAFIQGETTLSVGCVDLTNHPTLVFNPSDLTKE